MSEQPKAVTTKITITATQKDGDTVEIERFIAWIVDQVTERRDFNEYLTITITTEDE